MRCVRSSGVAGGPAVALGAIMLLSGGTPILAAGVGDTVRDYRVRGVSARDLVSYMKSRPFRGDYGPAMANIRPRYLLELKTRQIKRGCAVRSAKVRVRFTVTLPKAVDERRFDARTRRMWRSFRRFTVRHENGHRRIYMRCFRRFERAARRSKSKSSCISLRYDLRRRLRAADKDCDRLHRAFDRREFPRVRNLSLFRQARAQKNGRRMARSKQRRRSLAASRRPPNWFSYVRGDR